MKDENLHKYSGSETSFSEKRIVFNGPKTGSGGQTNTAETGGERAKRGAEKGKKPTRRAEVEKRTKEDLTKEKARLKAAALKKKVEAERRAKILANLDEKKILAAINSGQLNPDKWNFKTEAGIELAKKEWSLLGIAKVHSTFCTNNFKLLEDLKGKVGNAYDLALDFFDSIMGRILEIQRKTAAEKILANLDKKKIAAAMKKWKINPELWDFRSKAGLDRIKKEWGLLGIIKENPKICKDIFKQLERSYDPKFTTAVVFFTSIKNGVTTKVDLKLETQRKANAKSMLKNLSNWKISVARRSGKVNPELWDFRSKADLDRVKKEWSYLGITTGNSAYYNAIFKQLEKSHDRQFLGTITRPSLKHDAYTNPFQNLKDLEANTDPDFSHAVRFFASIKKRVADQDSLQKATTEGLQKENEDSIISEAGRIVRENLSAFSEAIKTRDYSTAAIYFLGIYAAYRTYKSLPKDKQDRYGKYFFWGATAYCGNIFLKKAGIDIMKKLGFKDADAEVRGTPMAVLSRLDLGLKPEDFITAKSVNYINFSGLYEKYKETNKPGGIRWIDPNQFPTAFGDRFKGMRSSDITKTKGLSAKQKAYKAKGESLYRVVQALEAAYNKTMRRHTDKSLTAVLSGGILAKSTVFDFALELLPYAPEHRLEKGIMASLKGTEKAKTYLRDVFDKSGMGFGLEKGRKAGHYDGVLMGFPVVYVRDSRHKQFLVFSRSDYDEANKTPNASMRLGSVPFKGGTKGSVDALRKTIHAKVINDLLGKFEKNSKGHAKFKNVRYDHAHGGWMAEVSYKKGEIIKGTGPIAMKVNIVIGDNGRSISLTNKSGGQLVYIKDVLDASALYGNIALSQLVNQRAPKGKPNDFSALQWFHLNGKLKFRDNDPSDDKFRLEIVGVPMNIWIRLKKGVGKKPGQYEFVDKDMETKLLENGLFKRALRESVGNNKKLQSSIENLRKMVGSTDESYFIHMAKNVHLWFSKATWYKPLRGVQLSHFTGSVAKNYTYAMIEAQREKVLTDFEISLSGAKSLSDVGDYVNKTFYPAINGFKQLTRKLGKIRGRHTAEGSEFDADEYSEAILTDLMAIGCKSNDYKVWYRRFSNSLLVGNTPDDIRRNKSAKIKQLMKVYAYYTAPIDDQSIDGANLWAKKPAVIEKPKKPKGLVEKPEEPKDPKDKEKPAYKNALGKYEDYKKALELGAKLAAKKPAVVEIPAVVTKPTVVTKPVVIQRPEVVEKPTTVIQSPKVLIKASRKYEKYKKALEEYEDYKSALEKYKDYKNALNEYEGYKKALKKHEDHKNALKEYEGYKKDLIAKSGLDKSKDYIKLLNEDKGYKKALVVYDKALAKWKKAEKHRLHAAYAQYVADQIYFKMKIPGTTVYPGPSSAWWNIRPFAQFDASKYVSGHELVDTRERMSMRADYKSFEHYLKILKRGTASDMKEIDRLEKEELVILPRKDFTVTLPKDSEKYKRALSLLMKIQGENGQMDEILLTAMEKAFYQKLDTALNRLETKYGKSRAQPGAIRRFLNQYRMTYRLDDSKLATKRIVSFKYGYEGMGAPKTGEDFVHKTPAIYDVMRYIRGRMGKLSARTITRIQQEDIITDAVAKTIKAQVMSPPNFGEFFRKTGPTRWLKEQWEDFKDWLWGLRNK